jgi:hypothetical protein
MINNKRLNNPTKEVAEQDFFELVGTDTHQNQPARAVQKIVDRIKGPRTDTKVERFRLGIGDNIIRSVNPTTPVCNRFANCGGILILTASHPSVCASSGSVGSPGSTIREKNVRRAVEGAPVPGTWYCV